MKDEVVVDYFNLEFRHSLGMTEETHNRYKHG